MARLAHPNVIAVHDVFIDGRSGRSSRWSSSTGRRSARGSRRRGTMARDRKPSSSTRGAVSRPRTRRASSIADFKPDNVLVAKRRARSLVVDFGLAHAAYASNAQAGDAPVPIAQAVSPAAASRSPSSLETPLTQHGTLLGTPLYMAPEQLMGERSDASGDQFSFCVSLYEALYGEVPFEGEDLVSLSSNVRAGKIRSVRSSGRSVPNWIRQVLGRGLGVRPESRYPSMNELLAALDRDPSRTRQRWIAGGAIVTALAAATLGVIGARNRRPPLCPNSEPLLSGVWDEARMGDVRAAFRLTRKPYVEDALRGVERALGSYAASWVAMRDDACAATRVRGEQSGELMDLRMECLDGRLAGLRALTSQFARADEKVVERSLQATDALEPLSVCADREALRSPTRLPADPAARKQIEAVRSQLAEAHAIGYASKPVDALAIVERAAASAKELHFKPVEAEALETQGDLLLLNGQYKESLVLFEDAVIAAEAGHHEAVETQAWMDLTHTDAKDMRNAAGHVAAKHARACIEREGGAEGRLATLLSYEGELAINEDHIDEAIELQKRALAMQEHHVSPDDTELAAYLDRLSFAELTKGDTDAALAYSQRSLAIQEKAHGPAHPMVAYSLNNLGNALTQANRLEEAEAAYRRALGIHVAAFGEETVVVADTLGNLGFVLNSAGRPAEAMEVEERSLALRQRLLGPNHPDVEISYANLAEAQLLLHEWDAAIASATHRAEILTKTYGAESPLLASPTTQIGQAYLHKGDTKRAVATLERALALGAKRDAEPAKLADTKESLALAILANHGDRARAYRLAAEARAVYAAEGESGKEDLANIDREFP
jgi:eukaryotic-like serine/threonine-protein kinase